MTANYKRIAKNTMMLYIRMLILMFVGFYTARLVLDTLGILDFGIYNIVGSAIVLFGFLSGTLNSSTQRFLTFELGKENYKKLKKVFSTSLMLHFLLSIFILIFAETVGLWFFNNKLEIPADRVSAAFWAYQMTVLSSIIVIMRIPYNAMIIAHERMNIFAYLSIVEVLFKLLIVYLLIVSPYDKLIVYSVLITLITLFVTSFYVIYCIKNYKESHFEFIFDKDIFKLMIGFSGWNIFGTVGVLLSVQGLNILLNMFFGPVANAARGISFQVNMALNQFVNNFQTAVTPQITKLYAANKIDELNELLYQNAKYSFLLLWFLSLPLLIEMDYVLNLWLVSVPENTSLFCSLMIFQSLIYTVDKPYVMAIHATGNMRQTNITAGVILLLVIPVSYILLENGFSIITPFIVYIVATVICFIIELYYLNKWISVSVYKLCKKSLSPILIICILTIMPNLYIINNIESSFFRFVIVCVVSSFSILVLSYTIALNKMEKEKLKLLIINKIKRL